jgi:hypothetical protein
MAANIFRIVKRFKFLVIKCKLESTSASYDAMLNELCNLPDEMSRMIISEGGLTKGGLGQHKTGGQA